MPIEPIFDADLNLIQPQVKVECGKCGGNICMVTCDMFRGTGHEWTLVSVCMICRNVCWMEDGCFDCLRAEERRASSSGGEV